MTHFQMDRIEVVDEDWRPAVAPLEASRAIEASRARAPGAERPASAAPSSLAMPSAHAALKKPVDGPSMFEVGLASYPVQPWTNRNAKLSQWFNYGLNPATWSKYSLSQIAMYQRFKATQDVVTAKPQARAAEGESESHSHESRPAVDSHYGDCNDLLNMDS